MARVVRFAMVTGTLAAVAACSGVGTPPTPTPTRDTRPMLTASGQGLIGHDNSLDLKGRYSVAWSVTGGSRCYHVAGLIQSSAMTQDGILLVDEYVVPPAHGTTEIDVEPAPQGYTVNVTGRCEKWDFTFVPQP